MHLCMFLPAAASTAQFERAGAISSNQRKLRWACRFPLFFVLQLRALTCSVLLLHWVQTSMNAYTSVCVSCKLTACIILCLAFVAQWVNSLQAAGDDPCSTAACFAVLCCTLRVMPFHWSGLQRQCAAL